jgi:hypothetical protein
MSAEPTPLTLRAIDFFERPVTLRLPFKFGAVVVREASQVFTRVQADIDGKRVVGASADLMVPKWFDKRPEISSSENVAQLISSLHIAREAYLSEPRCASAFAPHAAHAAGVKQSGAAGDLPPLVMSFGLAQIDRALIDAVCRAKAVSFADAVRSNVVGFSLAAIAPDLAGLDAAGFLESLAPVTRIAARHTVGMLDPLDASDPRPGVNDGLPVTLEEVIAAYGHTFFKLKVGGNIGEDVARLTRIAAILDRQPGAYTVTIDGNEQYPDADAVAELLARMAEMPALARLRASTIFIEQPIARAVALLKPLAEVGAKVPLIIDESDGEDDALLRAFALGYRGVSSKACKGVWRSLINAARVKEAGTGAILSGEDLTTQAGLAVQQDLALVSLLGLSHVERNGHHYVDGFGTTAAAEVEAFGAAHPDIYRAHSCGKMRLAIAGGMIELDSINAAQGLGSRVLPDFASMERMA